MTFNVTIGLVHEDGTITSEFRQRPCRALSIGFFVAATYDEADREHTDVVALDVTITRGSSSS